MATPKLWKKDIVLNAIARRDGMKFAEIQQLVVLMAGLDWEERETDGRRRWRGYWTTTLQKLLNEHCSKSEDGKWRVIARKRDDPNRVPTEQELRGSPAVRQAYEAERRNVIAGGRLPPGPFDSVKIKNIGSYGPGTLHIVIEDSVGRKDVRWVSIELRNWSWMQPAGN